MNLEKVSMAALAEKLSTLGGEGPSKAREWRIRVRLNWHTKAKSTIRHILTGARKISLQEAKEIELAHVKYCAEQIEANRDENAKLFASMRSAIAAMEASDVEFFGPQLEAMRNALLQRGSVVSGNGSEG